MPHVIPHEHQQCQQNTLHKERKTPTRETPSTQHEQRKAPYMGYTKPNFFKDNKEHCNKQA
jgi:hypothetical protein